MNKCYQCGWSNPDNTDLCQKCGQPINVITKTPSPMSGNYSSGMGTGCSKCGYLRSSFLSFCPWCGDGRSSNETSSDSQPVIDGKNAVSEKAMERPYLEKVDDGTSEIIPLLDSHEVLLNGVAYIYHHR